MVIDMKGFVISMLVGIVAMLLLHMVDDLTHSYIPTFNDEMCEQIMIQEELE